MKLYVWENVLCDWTCGIAFALAPNKEEAIKAIEAEYSFSIPELRTEKPKVIDTNRKTPVAFTCSGGG